MKKKIGQAIARISIYILTEIAFYNILIFILDNCVTVYR